MHDALGIIDFGVLTKQLVFGLIGLVIGSSYVVGGALWLKGWQQGAGHPRRYNLACALLLWMYATFSVEPLLQVFGVPDLPLFNWHVLLLVIPAIGIVVALVGIVVENDWRPKGRP